MAALKPKKGFKIPFCVPKSAETVAADSVNDINQDITSRINTQVLEQAAPKVKTPQKPKERSPGKKTDENISPQKIAGKKTPKGEQHNSSKNIPLKEINSEGKGDKSPKKDEIKVSRSTPSKESKRKEKSPVKPLHTYTDAEYDELFAAVQERVTSGDLSFTPEDEKVKENTSKEKEERADNMETVPKDCDNEDDDVAEIFVDEENMDPVLSQKIEDDFEAVLEAGLSVLEDDLADPVEDKEPRENTDEAADDENEENEDCEESDQGDIDEDKLPTEIRAAVLSQVNEITPVSSTLNSPEPAPNDSSTSIKPPKLKTQKKPKEKSLVKQVHKKKVSKKKQMQERTLIENGTWVQCSERNCMKWRYLDYIHDPASLPDTWTCNMSKDPQHNSCDVPEVDWDRDAHERDFIYTKFTEGSVVWAKMEGFPYWPAMVEIDPDTETYCEIPNAFPGDSMSPSHYHVVFFDDRVTRAWIRVSNIRNFTGNETSEHLGSFKVRNHDYRKEVTLARTKAIRAHSLGIKERLAEFSFCQRYHGKWGDVISSQEENNNASDSKHSKLKRKSKKTASAPILNEGDVDDMLGSADEILDQAEDILNSMDLEDDLISDQINDKDEYMFKDDETDDPPKRKKLKKSKKHKRSREERALKKENCKNEEPGKKRRHSDLDETSTKKKKRSSKKPQIPANSKMVANPLTIRKPTFLANKTKMNKKDFVKTDNKSDETVDETGSEEEEEDKIVCSGKSVTLSLELDGEVFTMEIDNTDAQDDHVECKHPKDSEKLKQMIESTLDKNDQGPIDYNKVEMKPGSKKSNPGLDKASKSSNKKFAAPVTRKVNEENADADDVKVKQVDKKREEYKLSQKLPRSNPKLECLENEISQKSGKSKLDNETQDVDYHSQRLRKSQGSKLSKESQDSEKFSQKSGRSKLDEESQDSQDFDNLSQKSGKSRRSELKEKSQDFNDLSQLSRKSLSSKLSSENQETLDFVNLSKKSTKSQKSMLSEKSQESQKSRKSDRSKKKDESQDFDNLSQKSGKSGRSKAKEKLSQDFDSLSQRSTRSKTRESQTSQDFDFNTSVKTLSQKSKTSQYDEGSSDFDFGDNEI